MNTLALFRRAAVAAATGAILLLPLAGVASAAPSASAPTAPPLSAVPVDPPARLGAAVSDSGTQIRVAGMTMAVTVVCSPGAGRYAWQNPTEITPIDSGKGTPAFGTANVLAVDTDTTGPVEVLGYNASQKMLFRTGCFRFDSSYSPVGYTDSAALSGLAGSYDRGYTPTPDDLRLPAGIPGSILPGERAPKAPVVKTTVPATTSAPASTGSATTGPRVGSKPANIYSSADPSGTPTGTVAANTPVEAMIDSPVSTGGVLMMMIRPADGPMGWVRVDDLAGLPASLMTVKAPTTTVAESGSTSVAPAYVPPPRKSPLWGWALLATVLAAAWNRLRIRRDLRGESAPGTLTDLLASITMPVAAVAMIASTANWGILGVTLTILMSAVVGIVWVQRRAANRGIPLSVAETGRAMNNNLRWSVISAAAAGMVGFLLSTPWTVVAILAPATLAWTIAAGFKALGDVQARVRSREAIEQALAAVLGITETVMETLAVSVEPHEIRIQTPPATAVRGFADLDTRLQNAMPEWSVASADARVIVLRPANPDELLRRAHSADSGGLIAGTDATPAGWGAEPTYGETPAAETALVLTQEDLDGGEAR